ncbi:MAG: hypothetical protein AAGF20_11545 [Pseudomonadota bacterium]
MAGQDGQVQAGRAQLEAGNARGAIRTAKQALMDAPNDLDALDLLSDGHMALSDFTAASEVIEQMLRLAPNHLQAMETQILLLMRMGWQDAAKEKLAAFKLAHPNWPDRHRELTSLWDFAFGDASRAARDMRDMLERRPGDYGLMAMIALAETEARNPFAAEPFMEQILNLDANHASALRTLAFCRFRQFRFSTARALARAARANDPTDQALRWIAPLSWLVWFPPFILGHAIQWLIAKAAQRFGGRSGDYVGGAFFLAFVSLVVGIMARANDGGAPPSKPVAFAVLALILAGFWTCAVHFILCEVRGGNSSSSGRSVKITGY